MKDNKFIALLLVCVMLTGCCHAPTFKNPILVTEPTVTEPAIPETLAPEELTVTEPTVTEPAIPETLAPEELTMDMFLLAEHDPDLEEHCHPMYCPPICEEHCYGHCVLHTNDHIGLPVTCPDGLLFVIGTAMPDMPDDRNRLMNCSMDNITIEKVDPIKTFLVCGIRYVSDTAGTPDPRLESDRPMTYEEMSDLCSAIPINNFHKEKGQEYYGAVYLLDIETNIIYEVLPKTLLYVHDWDNYF